ncbi:HAMP domain-containing histidine kinase [Viridibacillus sp. YIM B01967]|uniref:histidine kinase n=1 Tax=Viridibacillus soli TaxID=2798301 RepID=A0ABS1H296_9BACL|nr:HAMP domain-containing sensor histidine kinase [Viridibacillus soli]MBK3493535.1 HAMP domain-containing histidine kinase [Viridibacillus soli]
MDRYYIYEQRKILDKVASDILSVPKKNLLSDLKEIEEKYAVTIVYSDTSGNLNQINERIISEFDRKKIKLNKFWITENSLNTLQERSVNKIYDQGVSKYKVLTKFIKIDNNIIAIGLPLPHMEEAIVIMNRFNILLMTISVILIVFLVVVISKKITRPLESLKTLSQDIANLNFRKEEIKTNDEVGELAKSINIMSENLEKAHDEINSQNKRLKDLMSDISHELKTPLSLVKIYEQGISDGLDDGTYRYTIEEQIEKMNALIEKLLFWTQLESNSLNKSTFDLGKRLADITGKYTLILQENHVNLLLNFDAGKEYIIHAEKDGIDVVLDNLITNAIKYTNDKNIDIALTKKNNIVKLTVANGVGEIEESDLENIWRPFYVLEKSRSKELSGTGLGLPIIKTILENHHLDFGFELKNNRLEFFVTFA